ncbi:MAG: hypothetical protein QM778_01475 [Myxococcales bacterium]
MISIKEDTSGGTLGLRGLDLLEDMGRDGLSLAIRVHRKQDLIHLLGLLADGLDDVSFALLFDDLVGLFEVLIDVDATTLGQILDVALRSHYLVVFSEVFLNGLRFGRGLDDD